MTAESCHTLQPEGRLPVYFERTLGNITDVITLHNLLKTFKAIETKALHYVMDKGFYSKKNADELLAEAYDAFFVVKTTPKRGIQVSYNTQAVNQYIRLLSRLALFEKIKDFCADLLPNFESICEHMVEVTIIWKTNKSVQK